MIKAKEIQLEILPSEENRMALNKVEVDLINIFIWRRNTGSRKMG